VESGLYLSKIRDGFRGKIGKHLVKKDSRESKKTVPLKILNRSRLMCRDISSVHVKGKGRFDL